MTPAEKHKRADELRGKVEELNALKSRLIAADEVRVSKEGRGWETISIGSLPNEASLQPTRGVAPHLVESFPLLARKFNDELLQALYSDLSDAQKEYAALFSAD